MPVEYREMRAQDHPRVYQLWNRSEGVGLSSADSPEAIAAYLARNSGISQVVVDSGEVVGAVLCGHDGRRGYLHHLAVTEEYRRQGIGRIMVERCLAALAEAGIQKCHIFVFKDNQDAQAFWLDTGWVIREELVIISKVIEGG
jgi:ribosomal protein S18 acetylase RimI-like enzyme